LGKPQEWFPLGYCMSVCVQQYIHPTYSNRPMDRSSPSVYVIMGLYVYVAKPSAKTE